MFLFVKTLVAIELLLIVGIAIYHAALRPEHRHAVDAKAIGLTMLTPVVGLLSGQLYAYYAYFIIAVAFTSRSRPQAASVYLLMLPMTPMLFREIAAGSLYLLPWSTVASMSLGALIAFVLTPARRSWARPGFDMGAVLLFVLFFYIQSRDVSATSLGRTALGSILGFAGPYLLLSRGLSTRRDLDLCLLRFGLAAVLAATIACFETTRHWVLYQTFNDALHVPLELGSATSFIRGGRLRTAGPMVDFSAAGLFYAVALMTMPFLKSRFRPLSFWVVAGIIACGLLATQSRGAWIGALAGFAGIMVYRGHVGRAAALAVAAGMAQFVLIPLLGAQSRLGDTFGLSGTAAANTAEYRNRLLTRGLDQVYAHPLFGQSPKELVANLQDMVQGQHIVDFVNSHLYIAMVAGVPGFLVWAGIWSLPLIGAWRLRRPGKDGIDNPAEVPWAIVIASMVTLTATSIGDRNLSWPTMALAIAGSCFALAAVPRGGRVSPNARRRAPLITGIPRGGADTPNHLPEPFPGRAAQ